MDKNTKSVNIGEFLGMITSKEAAELSENLSGLSAAAMQRGGRMTKITKEQLDQLADGLLPKFIFKDFGDDFESLIVELANEIQTYRKQLNEVINKLGEK